MPIETYNLGPGTLTLGAGALNVSGQVRACRITTAETVTTRNAIAVLSGEEIAEKESAKYKHSITGTFLQDLNVGGVVDFTWVNKGTNQPFKFIPATAEGRQVEGTLVPIPLDIGGDVLEDEADGDPPQADFTWRIIGTPDFENVP